jgi:hypothetical protein
MLRSIVVATAACIALGCTSAQAEDLALNKPASASSTEGNRTDVRPALANDGSSSTRWSSNYVDNQWWQVDLGSAREINRVELNWETAYASRYRIRTRRSSGNSWSTAATVTISSPGLRVHTFASRNARYVRVLADARGTPWGVSLWDARVCNNNTCSTVTPPPPVDTDGDGVADSSDQCPTQAGPASNNGCPLPPPPTDTDGDGVPDGTDQCPNQPGPASNNGCPIPPPTGEVQLTPIDGGPNYYGQFTNPLSDDPSFFPIAAWIRPAHEQRFFDAYKAFGMNIMEGVENPELANEDLIRANGMRTMIQSNERTRFNGLGPEVFAWFLIDEIDMCCGPPDFWGGNGYDMLDQTLAGLPQDGRARDNNYGKGVLLWESDADAARFINGRNGGNTFQQIVSTDLYWFTDPNQRGDARYGFGSSYGDDVRKVRRLDAMDGKRMPVWQTVELGWPFTEGATAGGRRILPAEIRSAVWHSLIAGARGIDYFDHNFGPSTPNSTILGEGYEDNRLAATAVNAQVKTLAPVLNAPFVTSGHSATDTMAGDVRYMVKWQGGNFYVFAGADRGGGNATFSIPCVGGATATRLGEAGSVPVTNGSFTDSFADKNAVHIYRIDGDSRCGL